MLVLIADPGTDHFAQHYISALSNYGTPAQFRPLTVRRVPTEGLSDEDTLWFEWGDQATRRALEALDQYPTNRPRVIVRIHDWEIRTGIVEALDFTDVDLLWFVNEEAERDFYRLLRRREKLPPSFVLQNAVDLSLFPIPEQKENTKRLAMLSLNLRHRKRYDRAIRLLALLPDDYTLHIRATNLHHESGEVIVDCRRTSEDVGVSDRVFFTIPDYDPLTRMLDKADVVEFFKDKSHILSTSNREAFHYAVAEGMACWLVPVVLQWEWGRAEKIWHPYTCETIYTMAERIVRVGPSSSFRNAVAERYGSIVQARKLTNILEERLSGQYIGGTP